MEREISIYIKNKKAYYGKDRTYNTIIINRNRITETEYRNNIIKRIIEIIEGKVQKHPYNYTVRTERKAIEKENTTPVGTGFDRALIGVIKRNENARREIEKVKQILKE